MSSLRTFAATPQLSSADKQERKRQIAQKIHPVQIRLQRPKNKIRLEGKCTIAAVLKVRQRRDPSVA